MQVQQRTLEYISAQFLLRMFCICGYHIHSALHCIARHDLQLRVLRLSLLLLLLMMMMMILQAVEVMNLLMTMDEVMDVTVTADEALTDEDGVSVCRVCGDSATGMYFGALVCVPCKVHCLSVCLVCGSACVCLSVCLSVCPVCGSACVYALNFHLIRDNQQSNYNHQ